MKCALRGVTEAFKLVLVPKLESGRRAVVFLCSVRKIEVR